MLKKLLVVDTNIISHALNRNKKAAYAQLFDKLEQQYRFIVTGYTKYELTCSSDKTHRQEIIEYIANEMNYVELSEILMHNAARIHYLYSKHPSTKGLKIGAGDIINASVAIALNCPLITIDNNDFPRPFFSDLPRERVSYAFRNKEVTETAYILNPDIDNIRHCFNEHDV